MLRNIAWHALAVGTLLLVGVPSNSAVIWIHTKKNSRVAKNKFVLIFAAIDLISLVVALPMRLVHEIYSHVVATEYIANSFAVFVVNGYLCTLMTATTDKFYAVMFPFEYRLKHRRILRVAVITSFGLNLLMTGVVETAYVINSETAKMAISMFYSVVVMLIFLTTVVMFVVISARLVSNGEKLRKVKVETTMR